MFTRADLTELTSDPPSVGVSVFLPTYVAGAETKQNPIRLGNLLSDARRKLTAFGIADKEADSLLEPAAELLDDHAFWQHQSEGLALFLGGDRTYRYRAPIPLPELVVVGHGFHFRPMLPVLEADGAFQVLTVTADRVRLFDGSRFALTESDTTDLPSGVTEELGAEDYENPLQASPVARPHTGSVDISQAQVYGDSPAEFRKGRLVEFVRRVAAAMQRRLLRRPVPLVLVADAEIGGHVQKLGTLRSQLAGVVEMNPEAMTAQQLHEAAYPVVEPILDGARKKALESAHALLDGGDARAVTELEDVVRAAYQGRVETVLLAEDHLGTSSEDKNVRGRYDAATDRVVTGVSATRTGENVLDQILVQTLHHAGQVHVVPREELVGIGPAVAILRF